jgi:demethylmacrocin O-methyltransferase
MSAYPIPLGTEKMWPDHGYLPHYQRIAAELGMWARVCELGVREGDSLRLWQVMFPHGDVAGVDCDTQAIWPEGTTQIIADQADPALATEVGPRDLIVDDASHLGELTMAAFNNLWPCVTPGGFYVIEDWWFHWGMKDSMLAFAQNLLPLVQRVDEIASITYVWGLIIIRKQTGKPR